MGYLDYLFRQSAIEVGAYAASIGTFFAIFSANSNVKNLWIKYAGKQNASGEPMPVDTILKFRFDSVLQQFEFTDWNKQFIKLYINKNLDPNAMGSTSLKKGIMIGVPEYYQQFTDDSIKNCVSMKNVKIDWDSDGGKQLLESLKLSEDAQKYIIGCNVAMVDGYYSIIRSVLPGYLIYGAYSVGVRIYEKFKFRTKPAIATVAMSLTNVVLFSLLCLFLDDMLYTIYFKAAEDRVSNFGVTYINGGIEYYEKKIKRNKALHKLLKGGVLNRYTYYTAEGNEVNLLQGKGIPDTFKLIGMKGRVQTSEFLEEQKKLPAVNPNPHPIM